jgi:phosphatidylinositol-bisphosphatase
LNSTQGNKGGTAIRLKFSLPPSDEVQTPVSTVFTFVNSHMAAFDEMTDKRNAEFHELSRRLGFSSGNGLVSEDDGFWPAPLSIYESDVLFWMVGDRLYLWNSVNFLKIWRLVLPQRLRN